MRKIYPVLSLLSLLVLMAPSCRTSRFMPDDYTGKQLKAGTSGGAAGTFSECVLLDDGYLFRRKGVASPWEPAGKVRSSKVEEIFDKALANGLDTLRINDPGNLSFHLTLVTPGHSNRIQWGGRQMQIPGNIRELFDELNALCQP